MKALIDGERICEIHDTQGIPFPVAPGLAWVDVPADTQPDFDTWNGREVVKAPPPPVPSLSDLRADMVTRIKAEAHRRIEAAMPTWRVVRSLTGGAGVPAAMQDEAQRLRRASDRLEARVGAMNAGALAILNPRIDDHWAGEV